MKEVLFHELEDTFSFVNIKKKHIKSQEEWRSHKFIHFKQFHEIFEIIKGYINQLNDMFEKGLNPKNQLLSEFHINSGETEIMQRMADAGDQSEDWENYLANFFKNSHKIHYYFIYYFYGRRLNKLNKHNFEHFIKFISRNVNLSNLTVDNQVPDFENSKMKVQFLHELIKKNKRCFVNRRNTILEKGSISDSNINLIKIESVLNHQTLVYVYKEKLGAKLERSLVLFCNRKTSWSQIDCNHLFVLSHFVINYIWQL